MCVKHSIRPMIISNKVYAEMIGEFVLDGCIILHRMGFLV